MYIFCEKFSLGRREKEYQYKNKKKVYTLFTLSIDRSFYIFLFNFLRYTRIDDGGVKGIDIIMCAKPGRCC